jgi:hypothetical protein
VNHRRRGFKNLLETWPVYTTTYEDAVANGEFTPITRAKISGLLKKFKSYSFLCTLDVYWMLRSRAQQELQSRSSACAHIFELESPAEQIIENGAWCFMRFDTITYFLFCSNASSHLLTQTYTYYFMSFIFKQIAYKDKHAFSSCFLCPQ